MPLHLHPPTGFAHSPFCGNCLADFGQVSNQAGPCAHGSTAQKKNASTVTNATAISTVITTRRRIDMAVERRAIEVETTPMHVTPTTAAEMKHSVSQVEAAGSEAITVYMRMRGLEPPRPYGHTDLNRARLPIPPHPRGES